MHALSKRKKLAFALRENIILSTSSLVRKKRKKQGRKEGKEGREEGKRGGEKKER